ncbi:hypothetical protein [Streptomyces sp. A5-4]|uniref:hypothetical protein n=1 Tax=Streptomyces sp. A5-4 TaxID=3384771 RepID=UPI003DA99F2D
MHAVVSGRRWLFAAGAVVACTLTSHPAQADVDLGNGGQGEVDTSNKRDGQNLESRITYTGSTRGSDGKSSGRVTPVGDWKPPACWYEPYSAKTFAEHTEGGYDLVANDPKQPSYAKSAVAQFRDIYKDGEYKDYNLDKASEGNWWVGTRDPDRWLESEAQTCNKLPFWVVNGEQPNVPNAITPEILAHLAYSQLRLPDTKVDLAPEGVTKVNLPTWAWLDESKFKPVEVTARLNVNGLNLQATTTAKPISLKLEPGTKDAALHPASGECTFSASGSIGESFAKGRAQETPPCGITYLRSSGNGTYKLQATVTWSISWTGTGSPNATGLPNGTFGNDQAVTVQEIQTINR